jgi:glycine cleavage system H protein
MEFKGIQIPDDLYYDKQHGWARVEGNIVAQGLTDFGQRIAQEIVFVESPLIGRDVQQGDTLLSLESGKWVGRIPAMVSGSVSEVNEELEWEPDTINSSPYDEGWLVKIEMADAAELDNLMKADTDEFKAFLEEEYAKYEEILG